MWPAVGDAVAAARAAAATSDRFSGIAAIVRSAAAVNCGRPHERRR